ncbi:MAG: ImmA/IrrE family metallo-endopeptidase [Treponema sp.]|nr:ImmA/IrrE family metallo-endopeptidase [Treponema sp.]
MVSDALICAKAAQLREDFGISPDGPIGDIRALIQKQGYLYTETRLPDGCSGESKINANGNYCITYNNTLSFGENYLRFTLAHELGHFALHYDYLQGENSHLSRVEFNSKSEIEREADRFAIHFLAPAESFIKEMQHRDYSRETISHLSNFFGISIHATIRHFMDYTDLACSLIVCNENFEIEYEHRSEKMNATYKMPFLNGKLLGSTYAYECIKNSKEVDNSELMLSDWYENFPHKIGATESVIRLAYNGKFLAMVTPNYSDLNMYLEESGY